MAFEGIEIFVYDLYRRAHMLSQNKTYLEAVEYFLKLLDEYEKNVESFDRLDLTNIMLNVLSMIFMSIRGWAGWYFNVKFASEYLSKDAMVRDVKKMIDIAKQLLTYDLERTREWLRKYEEKKSKEVQQSTFPQSI